MDRIYSRRHTDAGVGVGARGTGPGTSAASDSTHMTDAGVGVGARGTGPGTAAASISQPPSPQLSSFFSARSSAAGSSPHSAISGLQGPESSPGVSPAAAGTASTDFETFEQPPSPQLSSFFSARSSAAGSSPHSA